ncbi:hypothetical protein [Leisingera sp. JC11]|uniref:hypothetical protein n=1 Tax=Leisingera sp. JC11 TaxID=3042469 RepID=UPI003452B5AB
MIRALILLLAVAGMFLSSRTAHAQNYPACFNAQNLPVTYLPDMSVPDIAIARTAPNGMPVVLWNPQITGSMHPFTVEFFYYHECAHHALAHPLGTYGPGSEKAADCWAKQTMIQTGALTPQKYHVIRQQLIQGSKPGMDWPNGAVRVSFLDSC